MKPLNVLSLFDGISCGRLALERAGIPVENYFASEIDKYAIAITSYNFPNTTHIGDVTGIDINTLPEIDLLIGGSPCQGLSMAGKRLNFNDPRSALFFEYVRILNDLRAINPDIKFLLENVLMKPDVRDAISETLGVEPVMVNSSLLSAQSRKRLYWANFPIEQPEDRGILLKDVLLTGITDREKGRAVISSAGRTTHREYLVKSQGNMAFDTEMVLAVGAAQRGRNIVDGKRKDYLGAPTEQRIELNGTEKSNCLSTVQKDSLVAEYWADPAVIQINYRYMEDGKVRAYGDKSFALPTGAGGGHLPYTVDIEKLYLSQEAVDYMSRHYCGSDRFEKYPNLLDGKAGTLCANMFKGVPYGVIKELLRKLHPIECERLQTLPDNYTAKGIETKYYKWNSDKCKIFVDYQTAISQSQIKQLNSAISTNLGGLGTVLQNFHESWLIEAPTVNTKVVIEKDRQLLVTALNTINNGNGSNQILKSQSVRFVVNPLKTGQRECVLYITNGNSTQVLWNWMLPENLNLTEIKTAGIIKTWMENLLTDESLKNSLDDLSKKGKWYTTLIWTNLIMLLVTSMCVKVTNTTCLSIDSWNLWRENSLEMDLLGLKMESTVGVSNSARYKAIGNGWTCDVIAHILKGLK
jgi:site-specific DNA-cytosine methylase